MPPRSDCHFLGGRSPKNVGHFWATRVHDSLNKDVLYLIENSHLMELVVVVDNLKICDDKAKTLLYFFTNYMRDFT